MQSKHSLVHSFCVHTLSWCGTQFSNANALYAGAIFFKIELMKETLKYCTFVSEWHIHLIQLNGIPTSPTAATQNTRIIQTVH